MREHYQLRNPSDVNPTAAVIGSGFGGLALAIRLQSAGFQTTIFEQREKPGGRAYVYEDQGFTFDAGPTVITDPDCLRELFALTGRRLEDYVTLDARHALLSPVLGRRLLLRLQQRHPKRTISRSLQKILPMWTVIDAFSTTSEQVLMEGYVKLGTVPFLNFSQMIRAAPALVRLQSYRSVYSMVSKFIKDEQLRQAFSFHTLLVGGNPFNTSSIYALIHSLEKRWGVWFPKGGTHALVRALVQTVRRHRREHRLSTPVAGDSHERRPGDRYPHRGRRGRGGSMPWRATRM